MKVIINRCYGGFGLSNDAYSWLIENKGWKVTNYTKDDRDYEDPTAKIVKHPTHRGDGSFEYYMINDGDDNEVRTDSDLLAVIQALGDKANGRCASLSIVEVPDDVEWEIGEYDGNEWVQELHRTWS